jgi:DNA-directed RNA polymerase alpha subunit
MTSGLSVLSTQTRRALAFEGITSRTQLVSITASELKRMPGVGSNRLREIDNFLTDASPPTRQTIEQAVLNVVLDYVDQAAAAKYASRIIAWLQDKDEG